MNIKINSKNYEVPQLGFKHMTKMEDMGFSVITMFQKQQGFSMAAAFAAIVAECDREEAERLVEQHVLGGGDMIQLVEAFNKAVNESGFFKKLLESEEKKDTKEKAKKSGRPSTQETEQK